MAAKPIGLQDLQDRSAALGLPGSRDFGEEDLEGKALSSGFRNLCCALSETLSSATAAAKLAAKQLQREGINGAAFDRALQQLDKAVCGVGSQSQTRQQMLERLLAQAQARKILAHRSEKQGQVPPKRAATNDEAAEALADLEQLLGLAAGGSVEDRLLSINTKLEKLTSCLPEGYFDPLIPETSLSEGQRQRLAGIFQALQQEYTVRRKMLIERAKVTLQSMLWSKEFLAAKGTTQQAEAAARQGGEQLCEQPAVSLADLYTARRGDVLAVTSRATSGGTGSSDATVKSIIIGKVPDRGGRPAEGREAAAAAAMPSWTPRSTSSRGGMRGGSSGSIKGRSREEGRGGGRVQGGGRQGRRAGKGRGRK